VTCGSFSPGPPVSSTNKTYRHDIIELLLKVALSTIKQTNKTKARSLVFCVIFCRSLFVLFLLEIVLFVLFRFTDYDYTFGFICLFDGA
jgi:hypothetical protein